MRPLRIRRISALAALLAALLLFVTGCGAFSCTRVTADLPDAAADIYANTLIITHPAGGGEVVAGTGFVVCTEGDTAYAITNYHVVKDAPNGEVTVRTTFSNLPMTAEVVGYYEYHDIAVIAMRSDDSFNAISADRFVSGAEGDAAWSAGNEHGESRIIVSGGYVVTEKTEVTAERLGYYESAERSKYVPVTEYSCSVESGMSGCPIVSENGGITGVGTYRAEEETKTEAVMHYYGTPARIALSVLNAVLNGEFSPQIDGGAEVTLFGQGYYRIFIDRDGVGRYRLVFLGNYYDWGMSAGLGVSERLHDIGFTAYMTGRGILVDRAEADCPLKTGDVITAIGGMRVSEMGYTDLMTLFYDNYKLTETAESGETAASGEVLTVTTSRGEVSLEGGEWAIRAK